MSTQESAELTTVRFMTAKADGDVTHKSGYHQPGRGYRGCTSCKKTTKKGAYRDVSIDLDGRTHHYYHQSDVVVTDGQRYRLDSHGYRTSTTKERINRYLPAGYRVYQEDFTWYVSTPDGETLDFTDGMIIER